MRLNIFKLRLPSEFLFLIRAVLVFLPKFIGAMDQFDEEQFDSDSIPEGLDTTPTLYRNQKQVHDGFTFAVANLPDPKEDESAAEKILVNAPTTTEEFKLHLLKASTDSSHKNDEVINSESQEENFSRELKDDTRARGDLLADSTKNDENSSASSSSEKEERNADDLRKILNQELVHQVVPGQAQDQKAGRWN